MTGELGEDYNYLKLNVNSNDRINNEQTAIIYLKPGVYYYIFIVDGEEVVDENKPKKYYQGKVIF